MAGVYISYPFCAQKCTYCNFASGVFGRGWEEQYPRAVKAEAEMADWVFVPDTVYLGGGTPSRASGEALAAMLSAVPGFPWVEATMEAAPGGLTREKLLDWRRLGINRVSLGVQSFVDAELRRTGRKHDAGVVEREVGLLRECGIGQFNIDLIAGLPGQDRASWEASLEGVERLEAPHVSIYMLEIDEDSRLGKERLVDGSRYGAGDVPPDESIVELYETARERLERMGVLRYEISNFARPGCESRHNLKYWQWQPYLGLGVDAHSFQNDRRWCNSDQPTDYVPACLAKRTPRVEETRAYPEERILTGLRLEQGVVLNDAEEREYATALQQSIVNGLLERRSGAIRLTNAGVLLSNEVFQLFLPDAIA